jgi:hypothetical protein
MARGCTLTEKPMSILPLICMRLRRVTLVGIVVGFLVSACSTVGFSQTAPPVSAICQSAQQCKVPVVVDCPSSGCVITSPSKVHNIDANGFDVVWEIVPKAGQSYTFKNPGGIFFKSAEGQQLFMCHPEANGTRFSCHTNVKNAKPYEYGIELVGTPPVSRLDPWVVNH